MAKETHNENSEAKADFRAELEKQGWPLDKEKTVQRWCDTAVRAEDGYSLSIGKHGAFEKFGDEDQTRQRITEIWEEAKAQKYPNTVTGLCLLGCLDTRVNKLYVEHGLDPLNTRQSRKKKNMSAEDHFDMLLDEEKNLDQKEDEALADVKKRYAQRRLDLATEIEQVQADAEREAQARLDHIKARR